MHQTRKGQQVVFRHEAAHWRGQSKRAGAQRCGHGGQRARQTSTARLLHGNEQRVYGDSAYASQKALIASKAPKAKDFTNQRTRRAGEVDEFSGPRTATSPASALA